MQRVSPDRRPRNKDAATAEEKQTANLINLTENGFCRCRDYANYSASFSDRHGRPNPLQFIVRSLLNIFRFLGKDSPNLDQLLVKVIQFIDHWELVSLMTL